MFTYEARGWPAEPGELARTGRIVGTRELSNLHGMLGLAYVKAEEFATHTGQIHFDR